MKTKKISSRHAKELTEAIVFPLILTPSQKKEAAEQLAISRKKSQEEMNDNDRLSLQIFQLKFQLEDYIQNKEFHADLTFGHFLKQYVDLLRVKRKDFAEEISVDETLLSQFINQHRMPPDYMAIRLEIHSNNSIPATYWFKLVEKQKEFELKTDKEFRRRENKFVHKRLAVNGKVFNPKIVVNKNIKYHSNDPFFAKKAEASKKTIEKYGLPKQLLTTNKK